MADAPLDPPPSALDLDRLRSRIAQLESERERRREEDRLHEKRRQESLGDLAGGIAHFFNNLLTTVLGYAELAANELPAGVTARIYLDEVMRAADRGGDLTRQLQAYAGKGRFVLRAVDLSVVVHELGPRVAALMPANATLRLECAPEVPFIEADSAQIQQVILNLIANAAEAVGEKTGTITVRTDVRLVEGSLSQDKAAFPPGRYVRLEVADTGCGMSEATRERIFEPFFTTKFTGRGLGLSAVQGIVRSHGGRLRVTTAPEKGTTVEVMFPAIEGAASQEQGAAPDKTEMRS
jgi:signal transduction histidine kinase